MTRTWDNCSSCDRLRSTLVNGQCAECRGLLASPLFNGTHEMITDEVELAEIVGELEAPRRRWWQRRARG